MLLGSLNVSLEISNYSVIDFKSHFILAFLEYHNITMTYVIDAPSIEDVTLKLPKCYLATGNL